MSRYSDEEKAAAREESRRLLEEAERTGFGEDAEADSEFRGSPDWIEQMLGPTDPLERHRWEQEKLAAERAAFRQREAADTNRERTKGWERWCDARIARALDELNLNELLGELVSEVRHQLRSEFAQALAAYASKGDETVRQLRQEITRTKAVDDGSLVDLPVVRKITDSSAA